MAPKGPIKLDPGDRDRYEHALRLHRTRREAAEHLGITPNSLDHACGFFKLSPGKLLGTGVVHIAPPPAADLPIGELLADRRRRFELRQAHEEARKLIPVVVRESRPIGLHIFGDPHLDDDGCNLPLLEKHAALINRTDGLYAINAGDTTNNWTGRLARLYAQQSTSAHEAWRLAEWFVGELRDKWLFIIGGNHDLWSGAGDPLKWITGQAGALYAPSAVRVGLTFPGGRVVKVNARHDFIGNSQWNPAHGPMKAAQLGYRDHLSVAGHLHTSAYGIVKDPDSGINMHCVRVASYKVHDTYAVEKGLRDQHLSPCALVTIDPTLPPTHPDLLHVWWAPEEGADYLKWMRRRTRKAA